MVATMSEQPPTADDASMQPTDEPPPPTAAAALRRRRSRARSRPPQLPWDGVAIAAAVAVVALAALSGAGGSVLMAVVLLAGLALVVVAALRRDAAVAAVAAAFAAGVVLIATGIALGDRAQAAGGRGSPFPAVVGLPLTRARALFDRHGPVRYVIRRVSYGARGTVLRATGYSTDGTYGPGSTITLVVGSRPPQP